MGDLTGKRQLSLILRLPPMQNPQLDQTGISPESPALQFLCLQHRVVKLTNRNDLGCLFVIGVKR